MTRLAMLEVSQVAKTSPAHSRPASRQARISRPGQIPEAEARARLARHTANSRPLPAAMGKNRSGQDFSGIPLHPVALRSVQPGLQARFTISQPGDPAEKEADHIAAQVMRKSGTASPDACACGASCPKCRQQRSAVQPIQRRSAGAPGSLPAVDEVLRASGQPLEAGLRSFMEPRFGYDFSQVRVHVDRKAIESARELNARAYTVGHHVVLGSTGAASNGTDAQLLLAHELAHVVQQGAAGPLGSREQPAVARQRHGTVIQRQVAARAASENVWGLNVTRSMCGCRQRVRDDIAWANTAGATYAACDVPANPTSSDVEACFKAAHPGSVVAATTSSSGTMTLPPPSADPCQRIEDKAIFVHEIMHSRHTDDMARAQGPAFFSEWQRLKGDPNRLDTLRATFPAQVAAFEAQWDDGHDWAQDEVNSYRWQRRFLESALGALNRIC